MEAYWHSHGKHVSSAGHGGQGGACCEESSSDKITKNKNFLQVCAEQDYLH